MATGKEKRLRRIFREDGKTVLIPMDHGVTNGPLKGLENMQTIIDKVRAGRADGIVVHKGIAKAIEPNRLGLIVHLSGSTTLGPDATWKVQVCDVKEAIRLGADGVSVHINIGSDYEPQMLAKLGKVADECDDYGIPLLAMMYPRGPRVKNEFDPEAVKHASRIGAELGADVVKTPFTGSVESFRAVTANCPVPVVIAGGPKTANDRDFLTMLHNAINAQSAGVSIGRNVFQHEDPTRIVKAVVAIVHQKATVGEALRIMGAS